MDDKQSITIQTLEHFFAVDLQIKKTLYSYAFDESNGYSNYSIMKYVDKLYEELKYIKLELLTIVDDFNLSNFAKSTIKKLFSYYQRSLLNCRYEPEKLKQFYQVCISDMNPSLIDKVKQTCIGYYIYRDFDSLIKEGTTINEILHIFHSYISNNDRIYEAMNIVDKKENSNNYPITLLGNSSELAKEIFDNFPITLDCGWVNILSLKDNDKILIMVRDRGHALSIEIDEEINDVKVSYFIPKLINETMINALKGVKKVALDSSIGTTGSFITTKEKLFSDLFEFISMVPMDRDGDIKKR